jgi:hypothetical protein
MLLLGTVAVGINLPTLSAASPLPGEGVLDYSRAPYGGFAQLRNAFVEEALGITLPGQVRPAEEPAAVGPAAPAPGDASAGHASDRGRATDVDVAPLSNDDFDDAYEVEAVGYRGPVTARTTTSGATQEHGEPSGCDPLGSGGGSVWYRYRPPHEQLLVADTFGSDHALSLGVFAGDRIGDLQLVGCDSDAQGGASVGFTALPGTTYHFRITAPVQGGSLVFHLGPQAVITRASIGNGGEQPDHHIEALTLSPNGRMVSFVTEARNLGWEGADPVDPDHPWAVPAPCPRGAPEKVGPGYLWCGQTYVRDRLTHSTEIASLTARGEPARRSSFGADVSNDGCIVAFFINGPGVAPGGPDEPDPDRLRGADSHVYARDRCRGTTELVSLGVDGKYANRGAIGAGTTANGRYVFFSSPASNLVRADADGDDDDDSDVFRRDLWTDTTDQVSLSSSEEQPDRTRSETGSVGSNQGANSWNGRYGMFRSAASNLDSERPDTNGKMDVFVRDMVKGTTTRVSVSSDEVEGNASSSPAGGSVGSAVSDDGRYVLFLSSATNLVEGDTNGMDDLFLRDTRLGVTTRVNVSSKEEQAQPGLEDPATFSRHVGPSLLAMQTKPTAISYSLSPDGRFAVFSSSSPNLVEGDTNGVHDVFLRDLALGTTTRVSVSRDGEQLDLWSGHARVSAGGRFVAFTSLSDDIVPGDTNGLVDAFVWERPGRRGGFSGWR